MQDEFRFHNISKEFNVPEEDDQIFHLQLVLENIEHLDNYLNQPPSNFNYVQFVGEMKETLILGASLVSLKTNHIIDTAINALPKTELFVKIIWKKNLFFMKTHIQENISICLHDCFPERRDSESLVNYQG